MTINVMLNASRTINKLHLTFDKKNKSQRSKVKGQRFKSSFTLIELLVVIAIIGLLAALITVNFTESQAKSRDSKRKSDIESLKKSMELAKQDSAGSYSYPLCNPASTSCAISSASSVRMGATDLSTTYIKAIPLDPKSNAGYTYITFDTTGAACNGAPNPCTSYRIVACLENTKDPQKDPSTDLPNPNPCTSPTIPFSVKSL